MGKLKSYQQAIDELREIVDDIQSEGTSIDELADKIKRASEIIAFCKNKLRKVESDIKNLDHSEEE